MPQKADKSEENSQWRVQSHCAFKCVSSTFLGEKKSSNPICSVFKSFTTKQRLSIIKLKSKQSNKSSENLGKVEARWPEQGAEAWRGASVRFHLQRVYSSFCFCTVQRTAAKHCDLVLLQTGKRLQRLILSAYVNIVFKKEMVKIQMAVRVERNLTCVY